MHKKAIEPITLPFEDAALWGGDDNLVEIEFTGDRVIGSVPLSRISSSHDPYTHSPWADGGGITKAGVEAAIRENRYETKSYSNEDIGTVWTTKQHEERIAFLVIHPSSKPIAVEFPYRDQESFKIEDGNHRLAAAIFRGDDNIAIQLGGFLNNSVKAIGVICRDLQAISSPAPSIR